MSTVHARVPTASASRYLQQLVKYRTHKMHVSSTAEEGTIVLINGSRLAMTAGSESLGIKITVPDGEDAA